MTVIIGLVHEGKTYMGADSAATDASYGIMLRQDPKIERVGELLIGSSGSPRISQLVRKAFTVPDLPFRDDNLMRYMVTAFVDALRDLFKNEPHEEGKTALDESAIMVGARGHLYCIYDDYQVEEVSNGYNAIGAASDIALGSLHFTGELNLGKYIVDLAKQDPRFRLRLALEACQEHNASIREPFIYLETP